MQELPRLWITSTYVSKPGHSAKACGEGCKVVPANDGQSHRFHVEDRLQPTGQRDAIGI
jgi:hypothetical protein